MTQAEKNVLGKTDLVELIAAQSGATKTDAHNALNVVLEGITKALAEGNDVNITGFGKFKVAHRAEQLCHNLSWHSIHSAFDHRTKYLCNASYRAG